MNKTITILVVILLLIGGLVYISRKPAEAPATDTTGTTEAVDKSTTAPGAVSGTPAPTGTTNPPAPGTPGIQQNFPIGSETAVPKSTGVVVTYTNQGFTPPTITIKTGTIVNFINKSTGGMWIASNPHPTHTDYPGLDAKRSFGANETYSFTFVGSGKSFGYHNHLNPAVQGKITIQ